MKTVKPLFLIIAFAALAFTANAQQREEGMPNGGPNYQLRTAVSVFPNPAVEYLHVKFEEPIAGKSRLTVHNIIGNVLEVESEMIDEHEVRLKVKDLPVGYYLLAVRDENANSRSTIKFLKR